MSFSSDFHNPETLNASYNRIYNSCLKRLNDAFKLEQDDWGKELLSELKSLMSKIHKNVELSYQADRISEQIIQRGESNLERFFKRSTSS